MLIVCVDYNLSCVGLELQDFAFCIRKNKTTLNILLFIGLALTERLM
jgi:hypothetical protein